MLEAADHFASIVAGLVGVVALIVALIALAGSDDAYRRSQYDAAMLFRREFYLQRLAALDLALDQILNNPTTEIEVNLRLLPVDMVPTGHEWIAGDPVNGRADYTFWSEYEAAKTDAGGALAFGPWVGARIRTEVTAAAQQLLAVDVPPPLAIPWSSEPEPAPAPPRFAKIEGARIWLLKWLRKRS